MKLNINYNNTDVYSANVNGSVTKTLLCSGKLMASNVDVSVFGDYTGSAMQVATGTVTATGASSSEKVYVECGFSPDIVIISLADDYFDWDTPVVNDICINMAGIPVGTEMIHGANTYGSQDWETDTRVYVGAYADKLTNGFNIYAFYEEEVNGDWHYSTKTYSFKAIKYTGMSCDYVGISNETQWSDGFAYTYEPISGYYVDKNNGSFVDDTFSRTPYLYCEGASKLRIEVTYASSQISYNEDVQGLHYGCDYNAFYDKNMNFIKSFTYREIDQYTVGAYVDVDIPLNAVYFVASHRPSVIASENNFGKPYIKFIPIVQVDKFSNETEWSEGVAYTYEPVVGEYAEYADGTFSPYDTWSRTPHLYCEGAYVLRIQVDTASVRVTEGDNGACNAFYDKDKNYIKSFTFDHLDGETFGAYVDIHIPDDAAYFIISLADDVMGSGVYGHESYIKFIPMTQNIYDTKNWFDRIAYNMPLVHDVYIETNGAQVSYEGWSATDFLPCKGVKDILIYSPETTTYESLYNVFYDEQKRAICSFTINNSGISNEPLSIVEYNAEYFTMTSVPENACYVRFSHTTGRLSGYTFVPIANYTNLVPTSLAFNSDEVFNGLGYKNNYLLFDTGMEMDRNGYVTTGRIPYNVPSTGLPSTIYIKGATFNTSDGWCALNTFYGDKSLQISMYTSGLLNHFDVEELDEKYYKFTPLPDETNSSSMLNSNFSGIEYISIQLRGTGDRLVVTLDEEIE